MVSFEKSNDLLDSSAIATEIKGLEPSTWTRIEGSPNLMRKGAVALARWGAFVLPTHGVVRRNDGAYECSCDAYARKQAEKFKREWKSCEKIGKVPWGLKWQADATNDPDVAHAIWSERKHWNSNAGILCGSRSGLVALDIDGPLGLDSLAALEAKFGALPKTVTVVTGSGGRHYWFRLPPGVEISNSAKKLGCNALGLESTNVDVRGENGQVIAPPSMHKSGNQYRFLDGHGVDDIALDDVPYLPHWLVEECEKAKASNAKSSGAAKSGSKAKQSKLSPDDPFEQAANGLGSEAEVHGVDDFLARIGDHDGGEGFDRPIYQAALSYFARNGVDASVDDIRETLQARILAAECRDSRAIDRYATDEYLNGRIEQARKFIEENKPSNRFLEIDNVFTFESKKAGFDFMNSCAARVTGSKTMLIAVEHIEEGTKQRCVNFLTTQGARDRFVEYRYFAGVDEKTKKPIYLPLFKAWFESTEKRVYNYGITFDPSSSKNAGKKYNLFGGYAIDEDHTKSWERLKRHLLLNICSGNVEYMLWTISWIAQMLQSLFGNYGWAFRRMRTPPMATWIMAVETSMRRS